MSERSHLQELVSKVRPKGAYVTLRQQEPRTSRSAITYEIHSL